MGKTGERHKTVQSVDPVWQRVRDEAEAVLAVEPLLAKLVVGSVLNQDSFEAALIHRLSERLAHTDLSADLIGKAMRDALEADPAIGKRARTDLVATLERDPACHRAITPLLYFKGFQAIQNHRFAHALYRLGRHDMALYLQSRASQIFQVDINPAARIGQGIMLDHGTGVVVGETAVIGDHVSILQAVTLGGTGKAGGDRHPKIADGVLIGAGAKILGNITVGTCSRVAAGSVVLRDVPPNSTVAGVPAKIVGEAGCAQPAVVMDQMIVTYDD
ncbi:MAG: serine O-acetyltransferase [Alphaproteobacteria bacterium]|nr:serine O-acetyltransferase [Alphaproteobacteria bacterium]